MKRRAVESYVACLAEVHRVGVHKLQEEVFQAQKLQMRLEDRMEIAMYVWLISCWYEFTLHVDYIQPDFPISSHIITILLGIKGPNSSSSFLGPFQCPSLNLLIDSWGECLC